MTNGVSFDPAGLSQPAISAIAVFVISSIVQKKYFANVEVENVALGVSAIFAIWVTWSPTKNKKLSRWQKMLLWLIYLLLIWALAMGGNALIASYLGPKGDPIAPPTVAASAPPSPGLPASAPRADPTPPVASLWSSPLTLVVEKNASYVTPAVQAADGHLLAVNLIAPGQITGVQYECRGEACGWVWECPDFGKCNGRSRLEINGNRATWFARSNSGAPATLIFRVSYR